MPRDGQSNVVPMIRAFRARPAMGLKRSLARQLASERAEAVSTLLAKAAADADGRMHEHLGDLAYVAGAKADLLLALSSGHYHEARGILTCWRRLRKGVRPA